MNNIPNEIYPAMGSIIALEKFAQELDPEEEQRLSMWGKVIDYANQYLNEPSNYHTEYSIAFIVASVHKALTPCR